jgi:hypothetical protein
VIDRGLSIAPGHRATGHCPEPVGRKLTLTVQEAPAAIEPRQVLVCRKSPATVIAETDAAEPPTFVTVTACAALVVFSA